jgi:hypothetical protein
MDDQILDMLSSAIALLTETSKTLDQMQQRLDSIEQELHSGTRQTSELVGTAEAEKLMGRSRKTLEAYRKKFWKEGIHYFPQEKDVLYNRYLILDWQKNRHSPDVHQRAIELWQSQQLSNQPLRPGRRRAS